MKILIFSFTRKASELAEKITNILKKENEVHAYATEKFCTENIKPFEGSCKSLIEDNFQSCDFFIFISATGIAIRSIAPFIENKAVDPGVIVIDEKAKFVIPLLSGHLGGANFFAKELSNILGAIEVVTTATDINKVFAVDVWAKENNCYIDNIENIKTITANLLENKKIGIFSEYEIMGELPTNVYFGTGFDIGVCISKDITEKPFKTTLNLVPKDYHIGLGMKRDTDKDKLKKFFLDKISEQKIKLYEINSLASIDLKKDEKALLELKIDFKYNLNLYTSEDLQIASENFDTSKFVESITGTGSVCEAAGFLSSKQGEMIMPKTIKDGMTMSIFKEDFKLYF